MAASIGERPEKPYPEFPLTWHPVGYWAKKIRGQRHYFGPRWPDKQGTQDALAEYLKQKDDLEAGRQPRTDGEDNLPLHRVLNYFLNAKHDKLEAGELSPRTFNAYKKTCKGLARELGRGRSVEDLRPADFGDLRRKWVQSGWGPETLTTEISRARTVFKFAYDEGLIDKPVTFGASFDKPSRKDRRKHRYTRPPKLFTPAEVRQLLATARSPMTAMILLGINAGLGNNDCALLEHKHVSWEAGWLNYPRPKTGVPRRAKLWPETLAALWASVELWRTPTVDTGKSLYFLTSQGKPWYREGSPASPLGKEFTKLCRRAGVHADGRGFYSLRHTFATAANGCRDQTAVDHVMGHETGGMVSVYLEGIDDSRLEAVADHVHQWLF